jgi:trans-aconitate 2-methyltransferase
VSSRSWDAATYERGSDVQEAWAEDVLDRLSLRGDETVLDAGCGPGRVTKRLLERLPRGRVIAVDTSEEMVEHARNALPAEPPRCGARISRSSTSTKQSTRCSLTPSFTGSSIRIACLRACTRRCGRGACSSLDAAGREMVERFLATVDSAAAEPPFDSYLADFERAWCFPGAEETEARLRAAGFVEARAWLEPSDVTPQEPADFLRGAPLRCHLQRLPEELHDRFVEQVLRRCGEPLRLGYIRLQIEARRPV